MCLNDGIEKHAEIHRKQQTVICYSVEVKDCALSSPLPKRRLATKQENSFENKQILLITEDGIVKQFWKKFAKVTFTYKPKA